MSIDVEKLAEEWRLHRNCEIPLSHARGEVRFIRRLIRAVIADEAAKLDGKTICTYPVVPVGDVPAWFVHAIYEGTTIEVDHAKAKAIAWRAWTHGKARDSVESEVARRVAEAVADKDKERDACFSWSDSERVKLEAELTKAGELLCPVMPPPGKAVRIGLYGVASAIEKAIRHFGQQLAERDATIERQMANNAAQLKKLLVADEQLAASQAEVERLKNARCRILSNGDRCDCTLCKQDAELAKLREENARLSRPVEVVRHGPAAEFNPAIWVVPHIDFLCERNAREAAERKLAEAEADYAELDRKHSEDLLLLDRAVQMRKDAEAERDELREFVKAKIVGFHDVVPYPIERTPHLSDWQFEQLLAAHRAEKAKVAT